MFNGVFWGRSITASGACSDPNRKRNFGPFTLGFDLVEYNRLDLVEEYLKKTPNCVAVSLEVIQGEGGTIVPDEGFVAKVKELTEKYNCLMIADEVQTGLGRTGKLFAQDWELEPLGKKADITVMGKALSGGFTPVSGIVAKDEVMGVIETGDHGSTFGGNPL
jgi:ornithine--oxo-acid transaminase